MSKRQYSGDRRGTPWYDERITPEIPQGQIDREAIPDHALVNSRMREQRAADGRGRTPGNFSGGPSPEQGPLVPIDTMDPEVRAAIEALRGWVQECSDGVSNLGMRVAKLEDACKARDARQRELAGDIITNLEGKSARLNRLEAQADKCVRFQAIHPPVTEEDNRD